VHAFTLLRLSFPLRWRLAGMKSSFTRRSWPTPARRLTLIVTAGVDTLLYSKALDRRLALFKSNAVSPPKSRGSD